MTNQTFDPTQQAQPQQQQAYNPVGNAQPIAQEPPSGPRPYDPVASSDLVREIDASNVGDFNLDDGWYLFQVFSIEDKPSKSGNPKFEVRLKVADGPAAGREGPRQHFVYAGASPFGLVKFLQQGFGVTVPRGVYRLNMGDYIGKLVSGRVGKQDDNPQYTEVKEWKPAGNGSGAYDPSGIGARI